MGEKVPVAYDSNYEGRIVTFGQRFGFALFLGALGIAIVAVAAGMIVVRQLVPRIYFEQTLVR